MSRSIQLVLLCVVTLSYIQLGRADCDVKKLNEAVRQVLLPITNDIKDGLNSVKGELTSLNETVSHLSGDLEQHKNQTTSVLADLQSSIDKSHTEQLSLFHNEMDKLKSELLSVIKGELKYVEGRLGSKIDELNSNNCTHQENSSDNNSPPSIPICNDRTHQVNNSDEMTTPSPTPICNGTGDCTHQVNGSDDDISSPPCDGTGGWRRAVYLDMTDPNTNCPEGWNMTDYSKRTCGRATDGRRTCDSVTFSVSGGEYSQVCGRIRAYQWGWPLGFWGSYYGYNTVDEAYFDGVAVMHGSPRQHIWTFVAGAAENYSSNYGGVCACDGAPTNLRSFVGEDYFCESGYIYPGQWVNIYSFHSNDVLWDGRDCHSSSTCCSRRNPPYFTKHLNISTTDDIELRMCHQYDLRFSNIAVELVEVYVR